MSDELDGEAAPDGDDGKARALKDGSPEDHPALHRHVGLENYINMLATVNQKLTSIDRLSLILAQKVTFFNH